MFRNVRNLLRPSSPPLTVLGLHLDADTVSMALLSGDAWLPRRSVATASQPLAPPPVAALGEAALREALQHDIAARGWSVAALALVLETDAFVRDTVRASDDGTARERADDLRLELLARHPALGAAPRWVLDDAGLVWAVPEAQWQGAQALAQSLGATLALIGHADAARALAEAQADALVLTDDAQAALGAALGVWHGLQPQWWPEGVQRRRRRWLDTARHALRASALGAGLAALAWAAVQGAHAWHTAQTAAQPSLAELARELVPLQREWAQAQQLAQRAQQRQQQIAAIERQHRHSAQVLQASARVPGLWLASVSQQGSDWQWQGEAETPAVAQQLVLALTHVGAWRQAPHLLDARWQTARDAAATVWVFRIQAQSEQP